MERDIFHVCAVSVQISNTKIAYIARRCLHTTRNTISERSLLLVGLPPSGQRTLMGSMSVFLSVPYLRFTQNRNAVETSNVLNTYTESHE